MTEVASTGQTRVQFLYTKTEDGVHAWDLADGFDPTLIDIPRLKELLFRAVHEVLQPMGVHENVLRDSMFSKASYMMPASWLDSTQL